MNRKVGNEVRGPVALTRSEVLFRGGYTGELEVRARPNKAARGGDGYSVSESEGVG